MFELNPDSIKTNILSKFEEDWVKTEAARVLTKTLLTTMTTTNERTNEQTDDRRRTFKYPKSSPKKKSREMISRKQNLVLAN